MESSGSRISRSAAHGQLAHGQLAHGYTGGKPTGLRINRREANWLTDKQAGPQLAQSETGVANFFNEERARKSLGLRISSRECHLVMA